MNTLALQQQALLDALFQRPGGEGAARARQTLDAWLAPHAGRGLAAYQANGHALAERSLMAAYPVITQLIGQENMAPLARALWHRHPPVRGDLAHWGEALPLFLQHEEQLAHLPWLADVARIEWALHQAGGAPDAQTDAGSFARLADEDPQGLTLALAPGTAVFTSTWPVASLVTAHREGQPRLDEVARRLRDGVGESAVVWRQGMRPCAAGCTAAAAIWLGALLQGGPVPDALNRATACDDAFDLSAWLAQAVQQGLVVGVVDARAPLPSHTPTTEEAP
ncbi:MAG: DNA-binding domain-containing protein [Hydrogenophaga sp.]|uniref:HvfC/BufC family peptide modification chaperone n=1 Tax=Hydrogenophaga sp. TaxID=1904254 RepID=UPI00263550D1|nr:putative DNA-binding domain-containing protein [Hydrogenophaga sp.]MCV0439348.1 DNA-binding domain-containing protein [Hydrogenophaga sp.]